MKTITVYKQNYKGVAFVFVTEKEAPQGSYAVKKIIAENEKEAIEKYNHVNICEVC